MSEKSEALRLADALMEEHPFPRDIRLAAAELRRLQAENFMLAAGQCVHATADEGGTPMCTEVQRLQSARERDNVSFKQLLAQRDALLEALKSTGLFLHHCWCDVQMNDYSFELLNRQMAIVDFAIKAVEEGK